MRTGNAEADGLITWALATFHASFFVLALVSFLYWVDVLRHVLPNLNTVIGLALFLVLWAVTFATTRRALAATARDPNFVGHALQWGGLNGIFFFWVLAAIQIGASVMARPGEAPGIIGIGIALAVGGSMFAFVVGAIIGLLLGRLDQLLLRLAARLVGSS